MVGNNTVEYQKLEHQTQANLARGIVARSTGLPVSTVLDIESDLAREGLDLDQIENALIEKAKQTEPPKTKG